MSYKDPRTSRRASSRPLPTESHTSGNVPAAQLIKIYLKEEMPHLNNIPASLRSHKFILFQQVLNNEYLPAGRENIRYEELLEGQEKGHTHIHIQLDKNQGVGSLGLKATIFCTDLGITILQHWTCCQKHLHRHSINTGGMRPTPYSSL